ncbi:hypothetical protein WJX81_007195 [Elliptochloris bilobata]|uniref:Rieske domain-containing protein n=1 Tax=Elliptochloris bilobata TaxID=381761 RepID=A0AAW1RGA4_9CHLO
MGCCKASTEQPEEVKEPAPTTYDWSRQWYAIAFVQDLDPTRPTPLELLGNRLVLWRDRAGAWRCFADRCPHRLAPLSEGRIEPSDGTLQCSYHGWRFSGDGACTAIPQAPDGAAHSAAAASSRACAMVHPTQVRQGFVHVWGRSGPGAEEEAAAATPLLGPELDPNTADARFPDGSPTLDLGKPYTRDLPYGWEYLMENLCDPAHVPYAHHGIIGRREAAGSVTISPTQPSDPLFPFAPEREGQSVDVTTSGARTASYKVQFVPPGLVRYVMPKFFGTRLAIMWMVGVPSAPGRCRVLYWFFTPSVNAPERLAKQAAEPAWKDHHVRSSVFDGDNPFLHRQERLLAEMRHSDGSAGWRRYFMPTTADRLVVGFRRWLDTRGGGGPTPGDPGPLEGRREVLLDRLHQHTEKCPGCMQAMRRFQRLRTVAASACAAALLGLCASAAWGRTLLAPLPPTLLLVAGAAAFAYVRLSALVARFVFTDYVHADQH